MAHVRVVLLLPLLLLAPLGLAQDSAPSPSPGAGDTPPPADGTPPPSPPPSDPSPSNDTTPQLDENATPPQDFVVAGRAYSGAFLSFTFPGDAFRVENVAYAGRAFLDSIVLNASAPSASSADASFVLEAREASLSLQDGENAAVQLLARADLRMELVFAPGVTVALTDDSSAHATTGGRQVLELSAGPHASLRWDAANRTLSIEMTPSDDDAVELRFTNVSADPLDAQTAEAFDNGTLGGEVTVTSSRVVATDHGDMRVTASLTSNEAIVIVRSTNHSARIVLVTLLSGALGGGELTVRLDGELIQEGRTVQEVFDPANLTHPAFALVTSKTDTRLVVGLPHLSTHTIQVQSLPATVLRAVMDPRAPFVVLGALAVTVVLGYALIRRR